MHCLFSDPTHFDDDGEEDDFAPVRDFVNGAVVGATVYDSAQEALTEGLSISVRVNYVIEVDDFNTSSE